MDNILNKINVLQNYCHRQRGAVLMLMLVILIMGAAAMLLSSLNSTTPRLARDKVTADALVQAKEALISYAISSENTGATTARPGNFPCPDRDAPGAIGYGDSESSCSSGGGTSVGRLPWKSLGIKELLDANGEPLWYVLSDNFRKSAGIINSDTLGTLQVYDRDGVTLLTPQGSEAVAIVFAPGNVISAQQRSTDIEKTTVSNYLDTAYGHNNASSTGSYIAADKSDLFNDRLIIIRTRDFIPAIEKRIGKELKAILENYKTANGVYPYPATYNSCKDNMTCTSNPMICRGRFPHTALPVIWSGNYIMPITNGSAWFKDNQWYRVIYYSVGTSSLATPPAGCNPNLDISGSNKAGLFFMPGTPTGSVTRTYPNSILSWYLDDVENQNLDDIYVTPTTNSNDQLYVLP